MKESKDSDCLFLAVWSQELSHKLPFCFLAAEISSFSPSHTEQSTHTSLALIRSETWNIPALEEETLHIFSVVDKPMAERKGEEPRISTRTDAD